MHFRVPGPRFFMLPVTDFTDRYPESLVRLSRESSFSVVSAELLSLKETPQIVVLDPLRVKPEERPS